MASRKRMVLFLLAILLSSWSPSCFLPTGYPAALFLLSILLSFCYLAIMLSCYGLAWYQDSRRRAG
jgi:hypothetical protein